MTVDVDPPTPSNPNTNIVSEGVLSLLKLFDKYSIKATFFVPAVVAKDFPNIMKEIVERNHEVACHGLRHDPREATLSINKELRIIKDATEIIHSVTGLKPVGFRAPLFKISEKCLRALQKYDYIYDSSIVGSPFIGNEVSISLKKQFLFSISKITEIFSLIEIPVSLNPFSLTPLGGAYFRIFGSNWCKVGIKINLLINNFVVFYIHPRDVDPRTRGRCWVSYRNTRNCLKKLEEIINYAQRNRVKFITAYEMAKLFKRKLKNNLII